MEASKKNDAPEVVYHAIDLNDDGNDTEDENDNNGTKPALAKKSIPIVAAL